MTNPQEMKNLNETFSKLDFTRFDIQDVLRYYTIIKDLTDYQKAMIKKYATKSMKGESFFLRL